MVKSSRKMAVDIPLKSPHKSSCCSRLSIVFASFILLQKRGNAGGRPGATSIQYIKDLLPVFPIEPRALPPSARDVVLQTLCPIPLRCLWPNPLASSCSEPCVARCADSTVFIEASPVVVTLPGPILTSFPQKHSRGDPLCQLLLAAPSAPRAFPSPLGAPLVWGAQGCVCLAHAAVLTAEDSGSSHLDNTSWIRMDRSLNLPENRSMILPLCTEPLCFFLLIKDFVQHSLGLVVISFPPGAIGHLL
ncbi:uncharacterized protein LOC121111612 [Gallus gallus]|uniref:uncharacterized protein LOC121111612 n=1 Tax=Gallus gallus TaxID=9031 RepID=UPI001EFF86DF|nr:uncharacterized protein LOC121111612 [Gallus gallus]